MAATAPTLRTTFATDAEFREWAQAVHDAIAATGLVQTSDTGQINLTTVAKPGAANTAAGYEIWRFDDALQATRPVFFKFEYGTAAAATRPGMWFTIGTATNGAGTLSGNTFTRSQMYPSADPTNGFSRISGANNRIMLSLYHGEVNARFVFFSCERTKDADGTDNGKGIYICYLGSNRWTGVLPLPTGTAVGNTNGVPMSAAPWEDSTGVDGADVVFYPVLPAPRFGRGGMENFIVYSANDVAHDTEVSVDPQGGASPNTYRTNGFISHPNGTWKLALRYD